MDMVFCEAFYDSLSKQLQGLETHITMIENEDKITKKESRMRELKNWLDLIA